MSRVESVTSESSPIGEGHCGCCGRPMKKATRIYDGVRFCAACYKREFQRVACASCGNPARIHRSQESVLCGQCSRISRKCLRCGRDTPRAALRVGEEVVCKRCRKHYPGGKAAPAWNNRRTCSGCYKYRRVAGYTQQGRPLCPLCSEADRSDELKRAENDYWISEVAERQIEARQRLASPWARELFDAFVEQKIGEIAAKPLAARLNNFVTDFAQLESRFEHIREVNSKTLLERYSPEELRGAQAVMAYLAGLGIRTPTTSEVSEAAEGRKIDTLLRRVASEQWFPTLRPFADELKRPNHRGAFRSTRTRKSYLQAATGLLRHTGTKPLDQRAITSYLRRCPGQRNALMPFVAHLRRMGYSVELKPTRVREAATSSDAADAAIRQLLGVLDTTNSFADARAAMAGVLVGLTGLPLEQVVRLGVRAIEPTGYDAYFFRTESAAIALDQRLTHALTNYLSLRDGAKAAHSHHLFPGNSLHRSVAAATVSARLSRLGASARLLASS